MLDQSWLIPIVPIPSDWGILIPPIVGAAMGAAQWLILRRHVHWAGWWIVLSALAWATGMSLAPASGLVELPPIVLSGVLASLPTGIALELLMRYPKNEQAEGLEEQS